MPPVFSACHPSFQNSIAMATGLAQHLDEVKELLFSPAVQSMFTEVAHRAPDLLPSDLVFIQLALHFIFPACTSNLEIYAVVLYLS